MTDHNDYEDLLKVAAILAEQCQEYSDNEYALSDTRQCVKIQEVLDLALMHHMRRQHIAEVEEAQAELSKVNAKLLSFSFTK